MFSASSALDLTFLPVSSRPAEGVFFVYAPGSPAIAPTSAAVAAAGLGPWLLRLEPKNSVLELARGAVTATSGLAMRLPDALAALAALTGAKLPSGRPLG